MQPLQRITHVPAAPARPLEAHKGTFGTVIVVGGSETMPGAPALCAHAAFRTGAGLVKVASRRSVIPVAITIEPSATGIVLEEDVGSNLLSLDRADPSQTAVLAAGPGLGQSPQAGQLIAALLAGKRDMVLDADGLNALASLLNTGQEVKHTCRLVLTPHPGEFRRLAQPLGISLDPVDTSQRPAAAAALARACQAVVVLKGQGSIITDGVQYHINTTGNPALATAGTGDVLTGCIAALLAQGMTPLDAATRGAYLHGLAGDLWTQAHGPVGLTARDLSDFLPQAQKQSLRA